MRRLLCVFAAVVAPVAAQTPRPVVNSQADLPTHTYAVGPSASALLTDRPAFDALAVRLQADTEADLRDSDITDPATRGVLYAALQNLAFLRGDSDAALVYADSVRAQQAEPADRLLSGFTARTIIAAERAGGDLDTRRSRFRTQYAATVDAFPWAVVQDGLVATRAGALVTTAEAIQGVVQSTYDPGAAETGEISGEVARTIVRLRYALERWLPYTPDIVSVLSAAIEANRVVKPDIWETRGLDLTGTPGLTPVVVGVWDSGVDASAFGEQMWTNAGETADGADDDGNGFVDDVHGIGYDIEGVAEPSELLPLSDADRARISDLRALNRGLDDTDDAVDSPEARTFQARMRSLTPEETGAFFDDLVMELYYSHGTLVSGVIAAGNPAARLLSARQTFDYHAVQAVPTLERDRRLAASFGQTVAYFQAHGVRVVNMSWGENVRTWEDALEANGVGADAAERERLAAEMFGVWSAGLRAALASAPEILFVTGSNNDAADPSVIGDVPASIDAPNVLTVAAVDRAGDVAPFTGEGPSVDVYANGVAVESVVPGGARGPRTGTSMAAAQVTGLAAKLFALDPTLTAADVATIIRETADPATDGRRRLMHPQRAAERVRARPGADR